VYTVACRVSLFRSEQFVTTSSCLWDQSFGTWNVTPGITDVYLFCTKEDNWASRQELHHFDATAPTSSTALLYLQLKITLRNSNVTLESWSSKIHANVSPSRNNCCRLILRLQLYKYLIIQMASPYWLDFCTCFYFVGKRGLLPSICLSVCLFVCSAIDHRIYIQFNIGGLMKML
jgi:hypothetical protein